MTEMIISTAKAISMLKKEFGPTSIAMSDFGSGFKVRKASKDGYAFVKGYDKVATVTVTLNWHTGAGIYNPEWVETARAIADVKLEKAKALFEAAGYEVKIEGNAKRYAFVIGKN